MKLNFYFLCVLFFVTPPSFAQLSVDDFVKRADYLAVDISPNGQYLAEVWNRYEDDIRVVTIKDLSLAEQPIIGTFTDQINKPFNISWANNERLLIWVKVPFKRRTLQKLINNEESFDFDDYEVINRLYAVSPDTKNVVKLFNDGRGSAGWQSPEIHNALLTDPEHVLLFGYKANSLSIFKVNVYDGSSELHALGRSNTFEYFSDYLGKPLYRFDYKVAAHEVQIFDIRDPSDVKFIQAIKRHDEGDNFLLDGHYGVLDDQLLYLKKNEESGYQELWAYDSKAKLFSIKVGFPDHGVTSVLTSEFTGQAVGYGLEGIHQQTFFDQRLQEDYDQLAIILPDNFTYVASTEDGRKSIIKSSGRANPANYHFYNRDLSTLARMPDGYWSLSTDSLAMPVKESYLTRDGVEIESYVLLPPGYSAEIKYPLVVLPHGGPQERDGEVFDNFAQFVSTRGYIVIQPNFRGSTGYGKGFEEAGYKQWGGLMQDDVTDAVHYMIKKGYADETRICIVGLSYGGYAALMGLIKTPELYQCAISINSVTDLPKLINSLKGRNNDRVWRNDNIYERIGRNRGDDKEWLRLNSPARHVDKITKPLLFVESGEDRLVPSSQGNAMLRSLRRYKKEYQYIYLEDSGHNPFEDSSDKTLLYTEVEAFLAKYLKRSIPVR